MNQENSEVAWGNSSVSQDQQLDSLFDTDASVGNIAGDRPFGSVKRKLVILLISLTGAILLRAIVAAVSQDSSGLRRLLAITGESDQPILQIVPVAILFLFLWVVFDLLYKLQAIIRRNRGLTTEVANRISTALRKGDVPDAITYIRSFDASHPVARLTDVIKQIVSGSDALTLRDAFRHQVDIEHDAMRTRYGTIHTLIWAMPILGFIGTVIGIGNSIGGFGGFLASNVNTDDVQAIKSQLSQVVAGLSYAFDTTLLGLVASLSSMLFMSFTRKWDAMGITQFEHLGITVLSSRPNVRALQPMSMNAKTDIELPLQKFQESAKEVTRICSLTAHVLSKTLENMRMEFAPRVSEMVSAVKDAAEVQDHVSGVQMKMEQVAVSLQKTAAAMSGLCQQESRDAEKIYAGLTEVRGSLSGAQTKIEQVAASLQKTAEAVSGLCRQDGDDAKKTYVVLAELKRVVNAHGNNIALMIKAFQKGLDAGEERLDSKKLMGLVSQMRDILAGIDKSVGRWDGKLEFRLMPGRSNTSQA